MIHITIVYAPPLPLPLTYLECHLPLNSSVYDALQQSGFFTIHPELSLDNELNIGIYGERVPHTHLLQQDDRIEMYRELIMDPKTRRKLRHDAKEKKK